jgi:hypothetical protein
MSVRRSKKQIEGLKKARSKRAGAVRARSRASSPARHWAKNVATGRIVGRRKTGGRAQSTSGGHSQPPRPKVPLLSGSKDPTLGERFEEELYRS